MTVAIERLTNDAHRARAAVADRASGRADGTTSVAEVDAYLEANVLLNDKPGWEWHGLRMAISLLATDDRLTAKRRAELVRMAVASVDDNVPVARLNQVDEGERAWVERLAHVYASAKRGTPAQLHAAIDEVAADGVITDADRESITTASRLVADRNIPQADEVIAMNAHKVSEQRARVFRAIYADAVRSGAVTGVSPSAPLASPSAGAAQGLREGKLARELVRAPRDQIPKLLASVEQSWPRFGPDIERLATQLVRAWDNPGQGLTSSPRLLAALLPLARGYRSAPEPLESPEQRAALARAVVRQLSDAQLASLDAPLAASLAVALAGGGAVRHQRSAIEEQSEGYVLPRAVDGPRTFELYVGDAVTHRQELNRLRTATTTRFEWRPREPGYSAPTLGTLIEKAP